MLKQLKMVLSKKTKNEFFLLKNNNLKDTYFNICQVMNDDTMFQ